MTSRRYRHLCAHLPHFPLLTGFPPCILPPPTPSSRNRRCFVWSARLIRWRQTYSLPISEVPSGALDETIFFLINQPPLITTFNDFLPRRQSCIWVLFPSPFLRPHLSYVPFFFFFFLSPTLVLWAPPSVMVHHHHHSLTAWNTSDAVAPPSFPI
jgi:hypothetical protein